MISQRASVLGEGNEQPTNEKTMLESSSFKAKSYEYICKTEQHRMNTVAGPDRYVRKESLNSFLLILKHLYYF